MTDFAITTQLCRLCMATIEDEARTVCGDCAELHRAINNQRVRRLRNFRAMGFTPDESGAMLADWIADDAEKVIEWVGR